MKILLFILFISFHLSIYATEQFPDLLIIGNDTIYLKSFPLASLGFEVGPFGNDAPNTGCWRGYHATWRLVNYKLYLDSIIACNPLDGTIDPIEYLRSNGYEPVIENGLIFADWYSGKLIKYGKFSWKNKIFLWSHWDEDEIDLDDIILWFDEGYLVLNKL